MPITQEDRARIIAAVHDAEADTSGEIVCVIARASSNYGYVPIVWASFLALALPWPLIVFTSISVQDIYMAQLGAFALAAAVLSIPRIRMAIVPRPLQRSRAHQAALEQFFARGLSHTRDRSGVLIFVSLAERYARIVVDDGIAARVPQHAWQDVVRLLVAELRQGKIADGFVAAIAACGRILATHCPSRDDDRDELPDRIYVL